MKRSNPFGAPFMPALGMPHRRVVVRGLGQLGPGEGGAFTPPPAEGCLDSELWDGIKCIPRPPRVETPSGRAPAACRQTDGSWDLYDPDTQEYVANVPNAVVQGQNFPGAPASIASEGFCSTVGGKAASAAPMPEVSPAQAIPTPEGAPVTTPSSYGAPSQVVLPPAAQLTAPAGCAANLSGPARLGRVPLKFGRIW